jgi:hypothetical protein
MAGLLCRPVTIARYQYAAVRITPTDESLSCCADDILHPKGLGSNLENMTEGKIRLGRA